MNGTYNQNLVALSIAIAVFASYTGLNLAGHMSAVSKKVRIAWLIGGAIAIGIGIWSMHFVAMLALYLPTPISYDLGKVLFSILPAILASGAALFLVSCPILGFGRLLIGGVLMGLGIACMHYTGMGAMQMAVNTQYDPLWFAGSLIIAVAASITALWLGFYTRKTKAGSFIKISSAIAMGIAISGMHYTGMAGASFTPNKLAQTVSFVQDVQTDDTLLGICLGLATFIILGFTLLTSLVDRHLYTQTKILKQQQADALRSQQFTDMTLRIRRWLSLDDVLNTAVNEIRQALDIDRVIIYRFKPDWSGTIVAESVTRTWMRTIGKTLNDPMNEHCRELYKNGRVRATNNIYEAGFTDCHREILENLQVKANVVAPIVINDALVGLLCAHQCSGFRKWQQSEVDLFGQLAIQVSIAIEHANLLHELRQAQEVLWLRDRAIAAASNAIIITDARQSDNPIIFCNTAFENITGYSSQEVMGRNCRFLQGRDTDPATVGEIRNALQQRRDCQVIIKNYRKDGTPFWNQLTVSPVKDASGQVSHFIGVQADITERMQAQQELESSKETLQRQVVELLNDVQEAAKGDLTVRAEITPGEIGVIADFFNLIIESLQQIVISVKNTARQVNVSVGDNSEAMHELADEALQQAEEINYILESLDSMALSIQDVADNAHKATEMARSASTTAKAGRNAMEHTVNNIMNLRLTISETAKKVKRLGEASQEITKVVSMINQIALQTNVLSINTSIEAAKVGVEGQAFTVVAEEIGGLALRASQATKDIEQIVDNIQLEARAAIKAVEQGLTQVVDGTECVQDAKLQLGEILDVSCQIDNLLHSISNTTVSQAATSQAVVCLMKQIADSSLRTSDLSRQVSTSLLQTVEMAQEFQASVGVFKTERVRR
ncbi:MULTISPECIES: MHYT domain-containing protein [Nostocales]|uniref:PAS domain-containing protein n=3 Tax=Nostocales TaxID=1161 RepID=A0A0C1R3S1_9CYAN|nr:MHYT domain-containing protein [Tolypothrix bouteillei]KAF3889660.1 PAS domain-containing protein [Tolypothrix bouteillei VB521301]